MAIDYKNVQIKQLLEDKAVLSLLEAVKEYPMASIDDLAAKIKLVDGEADLSAREIRIILSRLEISSQSQRVANFPKVLKMIQKIKTKKNNEETNELPEKEEVPEAAAEPEVIDVKPDVEITDPPQSQVTEAQSILNEQNQNHIENLVKLNEKPRGQKKRLNLLPKLKFTASPVYFVIIFLLLIALIYWLFASQFYNPDSSLLQDSSLPVSP